MTRAEPAGRDGVERRRRKLAEIGVGAWSVLGVVGVLVLVYFVLSRLSEVVVPLVLALFVASVLEPFARWMRRAHLPGPIAALLALLLAVAVIGGVLALVVPRFVAQAPQLFDSLQRAGAQVDRFLTDLPGPDVNLATAGRALSDLFLSGGAAGGGGGGAAAVTAVLGTTLTVLTEVVLLVVFAFVFLVEGRRLVTGTISWLPRERRHGVGVVAEEVWHTLGRYFRGLLFVALVDASGIGLGLLLLRVPLALPLAVLVYLGAFLPVVGAFLAGSIAVLVALAERGFGIALAVLAVVLVVQQLEGNVLQPLLMGRIIRLPAFVILVAIAIGSAWLGVLGAFLAVPVAASLARIAEYLAGRGAEDPPPPIEEMVQKA